MKKTKKHIITNEKGITLITLTVTIIIILILAGISIGTIVNEDGLFKGAQNAKNTLENKIDGDSGKINSLIDELNQFTTPSDGSEGGGTTPAGPVGPNNKPLVTNSSLKEIDREKDREVEDKYGNKVIIPQGFKIAEDSGLTVPEGIVIEDSASTAAVGTEGAEGYKPATTGNQFVWIPVGTVYMDEARTEESAKQVQLGRYTFDTTSGMPNLVQAAFKDDGTTNYVNEDGTVGVIDSYFSELSISREGIAAYELDGLNATAKDLGKFLEKSRNNGGYYIARFEASYGSGYTGEGKSDGYLSKYYQNAKPLSKVSTANANTMSYNEGTLWNNITQLNASKVSRNMYNNDTAVGVESDLMNSYAWDTAIAYISQMKAEYANFANFKYNTDYGTNKNVGSNSYNNTGANEGDKFCNIYDMVANYIEWTTEYSTGLSTGLNFPCVYRGGNYRINYTAHRGDNDVTVSSENITFRPILYLKNSPSGGSGTTTPTEPDNPVEPTVSVLSKASTTKSITITVTGTESKYGMPDTITYNCYVKKSTAQDYPIAVTQTKTTAKESPTVDITIDNLEDGQSYDIKVTTLSSKETMGAGYIAGLTTKTISGAQTNLASGIITASSPQWNASSHTASVTITTTSDLTLQYQLDGIESDKWSNANKKTDGTTGSTVTVVAISHNHTVYARLWDGVNGGQEAGVTILDNDVPEDATFGTFSKTNPNPNETITATVTHRDDQSGVNITSCRWAYLKQAERTPIGTDIASYTGGAFSTNGQQLSLTALDAGTYYLHILTVDNAGNKKESIAGPITVNQPVTGVKLNTSAVTLKVGGTAAQATATLTATIEPSDANNKNVTWSSSNSSVAEVNNGTITAKAKGTATITVTTQDGGKTASCIVTVSNPKVGLTSECDIKLTESNYGQYLGRAVKYTPASPSAEYGTSTTYRLFYIDFAGDYGEAGAVYLKADCDDKKVSLSSYTSYTPTDNYAIMKELNPSWTKPVTMQESDYCASWILDPNVWENWKDTTTEGIVGNINYVVGAPSLEMYVDSYNKYLDTHSGLVKNDGTSPAQKLACVYTTDSARNSKGYKIGFEDISIENWANTGYSQSNNSLISSSEARGMYNPGNGKKYWLASPSVYGTVALKCVVGDSSSINNNYYGFKHAHCPLVSLKSSVQLELAD